MIEKKLADLTVKLFYDKKTYNPLLMEAEQRLERTLGGWFMIGLGLIYIAYWYDLDTNQCSMCNQVVKLFPSIDVAASKSDYPSVMRIMWLYFTASTPLITLALISTVPIYRKTTKKKSGRELIFYLVASIVLLLSFSKCYFDGGFDVTDNESSTIETYFQHYIFMAYVVVYCLFFIVPMNILAVVLIVVNYSYRLIALIR